MDRSKVTLGRWGEQRVARWYRDAGYEVLACNWRGSGGELDLVLGRDDEIVFCEVKTRTDTSYGTAAEAVDERKQRRIRATAVEWMRDCGDGWVPSLRFDVAAVSGRRVAVIESAF